MQRSTLPVTRPHSAVLTILFFLFVNITPCRVYEAYYLGRDLIYHSLQYYINDIFCANKITDDALFAQQQKKTKEIIYKYCRSYKIADKESTEQRRKLLRQLMVCRKESIYNETSRVKKNPNGTTTTKRAKGAWGSRAIRGKYNLKSTAVTYARGM